MIQKIFESVLVSVIRYAEAFHYNAAAIVSTLTTILQVTVCTKFIRYYESRYDTRLALLGAVKHFHLTYN